MERNDTIETHIGEAGRFCLVPGGQSNLPIRCGAHQLRTKLLSPWLSFLPKRTDAGKLERDDGQGKLR
jgi:hypothetical protein